MRHSWLAMLVLGCTIGDQPKGPDGGHDEFDGAAHCLAVQDWAQGCELEASVQQSEVDRCLSQYTELEADCGSAEAAAWAAAVQELYACYAAEGVCPSGLDDEQTQQQAQVCGEVFDAAVSEVWETCTDGVDTGGGSMFSTCEASERLATHTPPAVLENILVLKEEDRVSLPLPFPVSWYDTDVDTLQVSSNGVLLLQDGDGTGCCEGRPIPREDSLNGLIALGWTDLDPTADGATVSWAVSGEDGERVLTISFVDVPTYTGQGRVSSAASIHEADGHVEVHIGAISSPDLAVTVGIESLDGVHGSCVDGLVAMTGSWEAQSHRLVPEVSP